MNVGGYVDLLLASERRLATALADLAERHATEPDVGTGGMLLASWSDEHARILATHTGRAVPAVGEDSAASRGGSRAAGVAGVGARSADVGGRAADAGGRSTDAGGRSTDAGARSADVAGRSADAGGGAADAGGPSTDAAGRAADVGARAAGSGDSDLLLDLQDAWQLAQEVHLHWWVLGQAARVLRDRTLATICAELGGETDRQIAWLRTRIEAIAPQVLIAGS